MAARGARITKQRITLMRESALNVGDTGTIKHLSAISGVSYVPVQETYDDQSQSNDRHGELPPWLGEKKNTLSFTVPLHKNLIPNCGDIFESAYGGKRGDTDITTPGTYTVVLRVTDDQGQVGETNSPIVVTAPVTSTVLRVRSITVTTTTNSLGTVVWAHVTITDALDNPVSGVTVTGRWVGPLINNRTQVTNAQGVSSLYSKTVTSGAVMNFSITSVVRTGYTYNPLLNLQSTATFTVP